jgi:hypothetical protein
MRKRNNPVTALAAFLWSFLVHSFTSCDYHVWGNEKHMADENSPHKENEVEVNVNSDQHFRDNRFKKVSSNIFTKRQAYLMAGDHF